MIRTLLASIAILVSLACAGSGKPNSEDWEGPPDGDFASDRAACVGQEAAAGRYGTQRQAFISCMRSRGWQRKP